MSRYNRENPDAPISHDWLEGAKHVGFDPASGKDQTVFHDEYHSLDCAEAVSELIDDMHKHDFIEHARQLAAQCWCDEETKDRVMDPALCEAVAKRLAAWMENAAEFCRNMEYYHGLLNQCAENLGPLRELAFAQDDGGIVDEPLLAKMPELVSKLAADALKWKLVNETATAPQADDIYDDLQIDCDDYSGDG